MVNLNVNSHSDKQITKLLHWYRHREFFLKHLLITFIILLVLAGVLFQPVGDVLTLLKLTRAGRYLVLFQNNAEIRGAGGFLGSFAVVDLEGRKLKRYYFESNIYKKDNEFTKTNKYPLPSYFQQGLGEGFPMALRDVNYFADFRDSAKEIEKFYHLEYGDKIDGIIAINASAIADLLKITGPISVSSSDKIITAENFFNLLQKEIQFTYFKEQQNKSVNEPKTILKEMTDPLISKVATISPIKLYTYFRRTIKDKNIMFWFKDNREELVEKRNWTHKIDPYVGESIFISNNNIGGEKTSLFINEELSIIGSQKTNRDRILTYSREYPVTINQFNSDKVNKNYSRIFLPENTVVNRVSVNNIVLEDQDIGLEFEHGKVAVGFWTTVAPGKTTVAQVYYTLPISLKNGKIMYQKQPGADIQKLKIYFGDKRYFEGKVKSDKLV